jgi:hypothetical protein
LTTWPPDFPSRLGISELEIDRFAAMKGCRPRQRGLAAASVFGAFTTIRSFQSTGWLACGQNHEKGVPPPGIKVEFH